MINNAYEGEREKGGDDSYSPRHGYKINACDHDEPYDP